MRWKFSHKPSITARVPYQSYIPNRLTLRIEQAKLKGSCSHLATKNIMISSFYAMFLVMHLYHPSNNSSVSTNAFPASSSIARPPIVCHRYWSKTLHRPNCQGVPDKFLSAIVYRRLSASAWNSSNTLICSDRLGFPSSQEPRGFESQGLALALAVTRRPCRSVIFIILPILMVYQT